MASNELHLIIPRPTGTCAGVTNALAVLPLLRSQYPKAHIFANHATIHHRKEEELRGSLSIPLLNPDQFTILDQDDMVIGSAHGTPISEIDAIRAQGATFVDTTCPLVLVTHRSIDREDCIVVYVGESGHRETEATRSRIKGRRNCYFLDIQKGDTEETAHVIRTTGVVLPIVIVRQTTLPANNPDFVRIETGLREFLREFAFLRNRGECYATQNRQESLSKGIELYRPQVVLILTSKQSSNGMALVAASKSLGVVTLDAEDTAGILKCVQGNASCTQADTMLLVAAASVLEEIIQETVHALSAWVLGSGRGYSVDEPWLIDRTKEPELDAFSFSGKA